MTKPFVIPDEPGKWPDLYKKLRDRRLELQRKAAEIEAQEKQLRQHIIDNLPKSQAGGISGRLMRVEIVKKIKSRIVDADALRKYINRTKRFDLVQNMRPSDPAIRAMWEDGKNVPGVEKFTVVDVSLTKRKT